MDDERRRPPYAVIVVAAVMICFVAWIAADLAGVLALWDGLVSLMSETPVQGPGAGAR
jgi:hypothetical protein